MKDYELLSQKHFDRQAKIYDQKNNIYYSGPAKISCADVLQRLETLSYTSLLDVGCGTGYLLDFLARRKKANYCGLDLSQGMLSVARSKNIPGVCFVQGSAECLPFPTESFDVLTCIQSFHHYPHPNRAMQEAFRVLKPGGIYLLSDTGVGGFAGWIDNHLIFPLMNSGDCHTENRREICRRMRQNGFTVLDDHQVKGFIYTVTARKPLRSDKP